MAKTTGVWIWRTCFHNQTPKRNLLPFNNTIQNRCYSSSEDTVDNANESSKFDLSNLINPCLLKKPQNKDKLKSMWGEPIKQKFNFDDLIVRTDEIHYKVSEKNRLYQQTWRDCPNPMYGLKKVCCEGIPPPFVKRPKPVRKCSDTCVKFSKCPKIVVPYCRQAFVGRCIKNRPLDENCRVYPPFPSYSECLKDPLKALPPSECRCLPEPLVKEDILRKRKIADLK